MIIIRKNEKMRGEAIRAEKSLTKGKGLGERLIAVGRTYYTFDVSAGDRGLCPHVKNRPIGGRMLIV